MNWCNASLKLTREMTADVEIQVAVDDDTVPTPDDISSWVCRAIAAAGAADALEVSVRVVDEAEMQTLNKTFREQDKPTNVLSFPSGDIEGLPADAGRPLGDIVVCAGVVSSEAQAQQKSVTDHWAHMMVHGTLHLLGYDHIDDRDAAAMESLETEILERYGVADPYNVAHVSRQQN